MRKILIGLLIIFFFFSPQAFADDKYQWLQNASTFYDTCKFYKRGLDQQHIDLCIMWVVNGADIAEKMQRSEKKCLVNIPVATTGEELLRLYLEYIKDNWNNIRGWNWEFYQLALQQIFPCYSIKK
ncbi:MAG TPA: hypothetical protein PKC68_02235 [Alphaproteobacteria bacterium]|nr:hypothetical protein [Alphaproteobacteria bacterium]